MAPPILGAVIAPVFPGTYLVTDPVTGISKVVEVLIEEEVPLKDPPEDCACGHVGHFGEECSVFSCACTKYTPVDKWTGAPYRTRTRTRTRKEKRKRYKKRKKAAAKRKRTPVKLGPKQKGTTTSLLKACTCPGTLRMDAIVEKLAQLEKALGI